MQNFGQTVSHFDATMEPEESDVKDLDLAMACPEDSDPTSMNLDCAEPMSKAPTVNSSLRNPL